MKKAETAFRSTAAALAWLVLLTAAVSAQPAPSGTFRSAEAGYELAFPRDHGAHPDYRTEWWYYTGHLTAASGRRYGFEVTFFRVGVLPGAGAAGSSAWELRGLMPAHFAISDLDRGAFRYYEKLNRQSPFTASAAVGRLDVFNEAWEANTRPDGSWHLAAAEGNDAIDLILRTRKPPAVHGENGISVKAAGAGYASHYYSMTRLEVSGTVNGERCTGQAWMDHEFGSSALRENQQGWDWFSIQLDNDTELMLYVIRRTDGTPDVTSSGSLVTGDGRVIHLRRDQLKVTPLSHWRSPKSGALYPMGWRVELPTLDVALTLQPLLKQQELMTSRSTGLTYWEGAVEVSGSFEGGAVRGKGYVEMTGYDRAFRAP